MMGFRKACQRIIGDLVQHTRNRQGLRCGLPARRATLRLVGASPQRVFTMHGRDMPQYI
jgi:hypothetical protein